MKSTPAPATATVSSLRNEFQELACVILQLRIAALYRLGKSPAGFPPLSDEPIPVYYMPVPGSSVGSLTPKPGFVRDKKRMRGPSAARVDETINAASKDLQKCAQEISRLLSELPAYARPNQVVEIPKKDRSYCHALARLADEAHRRLEPRYIFGDGVWKLAGVSDDALEWFLEAIESAFSASFHIEVMIDAELDAAEAKLAAQEAPPLKHPAPLDTSKVDRELLELDDDMCLLFALVTGVMLTLKKGLAEFESSSQLMDDATCQELLNVSEKIATRARVAADRFSRLPIQAQPSQPHAVVCGVTGTCYVQCVISTGHLLSDALIEGVELDAESRKSGITRKQVEWVLQNLSCPSYPQSVFIEDSIHAEILSARQRVAMLLTAQPLEEPVAAEINGALQQVAMSSRPVAIRDDQPTDDQIELGRELYRSNSTTKLSDLQKKLRPISAQKALIIQQICRSEGLCKTNARKRRSGDR